MRPLIIALAVLLLAACTQSTANRVDERTFRIEGPAMGVISDAPNQRLANKVCPKGFRVIDETSHKGGADRAAYESGDAGVTTTWTIRCI